MSKKIAVYLTAEELQCLRAHFFTTYDEYVEGLVNFEPISENGSRKKLNIDDTDEIYNNTKKAINKTYYSFLDKKINEIND